MSTTSATPGSHPDLTAVLRGDLPNDELLDAGRHLEGCVGCRDALLDAAVSHGLLTRASRALGRAGAPDGPTEGHADAVPPAASAMPLPPLRMPPARRRRRAPALVAAAAAVVLGGGAVWWWAGSGDPEPPPAGRTVALQPVEGAGTGAVRLAEAQGRTVVTISTEGLPDLGPREFYYAWLLDPATQKMLPLGQVGSGRPATFELDDALVTSYSAIDVSLEADDGDPGHSPTSLLRGDYDPDDDA